MSKNAEFLRLVCRAVREPWGRAWLDQILVVARKQRQRVCDRRAEELLRQVFEVDRDGGQG